MSHPQNHSLSRIPSFVQPKAVVSEPVAPPANPASPPAPIKALCPLQWPALHHELKNCKCFRLNVGFPWNTWSRPPDGSNPKLLPGGYTSSPLYPMGIKNSELALLAAASKPPNQNVSSLFVPISHSPSPEPLPLEPGPRRSSRRRTARSRR